MTPSCPVTSCRRSSRAAVRSSRSWNSRRSSSRPRTSSCSSSSPCCSPAAASEPAIPAPEALPGLRERPRPAHIPLHRAPSSCSGRQTTRNVTGRSPLYTHGNQHIGLNQTSGPELRHSSRATPYAEHRAASPRAIATARLPRDRRTSAATRAAVVFPAPSIPSMAMNEPRGTQRDLPRILSSPGPVSRPDAALAPHGPCAGAAVPVMSPPWPRSCATGHRALAPRRAGPVKAASRLG